jgi:DNA-binding transcriptional MerR regulator
MFRIGEFAALTRVSQRMLRHYDALGLLKPDTVDPRSGYRYYSAAQLPLLNQILTLREFGFSLEDIARLLLHDLQADELGALLRGHQDELRQRIRADQQRLVQLRAWISGLGHEARFGVSDVVIRSVAPTLVAACRATVPDFGKPVEHLFDRTEAHVAASRARADSSPMLVLHSGLAARPIDVEVAIPIRMAVPASEHVRVRELEGAEHMACLVYTGGYDQTDLALTMMTEWLNAMRYRIAGPAREVYLRFGADEPVSSVLPQRFLTQRAEEYVTEIQVPIGVVGHPARSG